MLNRISNILTKMINGYVCIGYKDVCKCNGCKGIIGVSGLGMDWVRTYPYGCDC
jgi:hypothetical protein